MTTPTDIPALLARAKEWLSTISTDRRHVLTVELVANLAAALEQVQEERFDWARRFMLDGHTPWEWETMYHAANGRAESLRAERDAALDANRFLLESASEMEEQRDDALALLREAKEYLPTVVSGNLLLCAICGAASRHPHLSTCIRGRIEALLAKVSTAAPEIL